MKTDDVQNAVKALTAGDLTWVLENFNKKEQVFTFVSSDTGKSIHINVTRLIDALDAKRIKGAEFRFMGISQDLYDLILTKQGVEHHHIMTITNDEAAYDPAIVLEDGDEHIIIDGNHKIAKAYEIGLRRRPAIFIPYENVTPYFYHVPKRISDVMDVCTKNNIQFGYEILKEFIARKAIPIN